MRTDQNVVFRILLYRLIKHNDRFFYIAGRILFEIPLAVIIRNI